MVRLKNIGHSEAYEIQTTSRIEMENRLFENKIITKVKQTLLDQSEGGDLIGVEVISNQQSAKDASSILMSELNELNKYLVFETDLKGDILHITNFTDLGNKWYPLKEQMKTKYGRNLQIEQFLAAFEKNLFAGEALMLETMKYKGIYGVLFSGIYSFGETPEFQSNRNIKGFFNQIDLPLAIDMKTATEVKSDLPLFILNGQGRLDSKRFDDDAFRKMIRQIRDSFNLKVNLEISFFEQYEIRQSDSWIGAAKQYLKAEVPGIYSNEIQHLLTSKN